MEKQARRVVTKRDILVDEFKRILQEANDSGLPKDATRQIILRRKIGSHAGGKRIAKDLGNAVATTYHFGKLALFSILLPVLVAILASFSQEDFDLSLVRDRFEESRCLVDLGFLEELTRPVSKCESMCVGLTEVPVVGNISKSEFAEKYAYSARPLLVTDCASSWPAIKEFSYDFFKNLYTHTEGALDVTEEDCQFFPYKTDFHSLSDFFGMSDSRSSLQANETTWYVGWSNCHPRVASTLRQHYERPYFLPENSESSVTDWIFMGGWGEGAFLHLDSVSRPSWQAQISGKKKWTLVPPPECEHVCQSLAVTVDKGDIIILDTNQWYHATEIYEGEISITIGSEFD